MNNFDDNWLKVGELVAVHGLHGELRVNPRSDFPERFTDPGQRWIGSGRGEPREMELVSGRRLPGKSLYVIRFKGVSTRQCAQELIGESLLVPSEDRPELPEGEFHFLDLVGLQVRLDPIGDCIGHVTDLTKAGNDLLEIELLEGRKVLVPFVEQIVPEVDLARGWLLVKPPPGLFEL